MGEVFTETFQNVLRGAEEVWVIEHQYNGEWRVALFPHAGDANEYIQLLLRGGLDVVVFDKYRVSDKGLATLLSGSRRVTARRGEAEKLPREIESESEGES